MISRSARSISLSWKGPAVALSLARAPSLNEFGAPITSFGYSGLKRARQSAYGLLKVTLTSRSFAPRSIFWMRSYPALRAVQYAESLPLSARHWATKSAAPSSRPSLHTACWLSL